MATVEVVDTAASVGRRAAALMVADITAAVRAHGDATWVATGGATAATAYGALARAQTGGGAWDQLRILMGDERCVPPEHPDSNWGRLCALLLDLPATGHAIPLRPLGELGPDRAADLYEDAMRTLPTCANGWPRLDHVWLGMGEDGHTLSLFPGHTATRTTGRLVVPVRAAPKPPPDRVSMTFEALRGTAHCVILVAGTAKRDVLARAIAGDASLPVTVAAQTVEVAGGRVSWIVDTAAAELLALPLR